MSDITARLQKFICVTNDRVTEERNQILRDAIQEITDLRKQLAEKEKDDWKKYD